MENLKTVFTNKFHERDPPVVFNKEHWSKILESVCNMKIKYFRTNNIELNITKQQEGK